MGAVFEGSFAHVDRVEAVGEGRGELAGGAVEVGSEGQCEGEFEARVVLRRGQREKGRKRRGRTWRTLCLRSSKE